MYFQSPVEVPHQRTKVMLCTKHEEQKITLVTAAWKLKLFKGTGELL